MRSWARMFILRLNHSYEHSAADSVGSPPPASGSDGDGGVVAYDQSELERGGWSGGVVAHDQSELEFEAMWGYRPVRMSQHQNHYMRHNMIYRSTPAWDLVGAGRLHTRFFPEQFFFMYPTFDGVAVKRITSQRWDEITEWHTQQESTEWPTLWRLE